MVPTKQSEFSVMVLAEWMVRHHDNVGGVIDALCDIFTLPDRQAVAIYVDQEIERQARLLLIADDREILAIAGWNWNDAHYPASGLRVYAGIRPYHPPTLEVLLLDRTIERLSQERQLADNRHVNHIVFQYNPADRELAKTCRQRGYRRDRERNDSFQYSLGASGSLRSFLIPFVKP